MFFGRIGLVEMIIYIYDVNIKYEWDDDKNIANKKKHDGIGFETAVEEREYYADYDLR